LTCLQNLTLWKHARSMGLSMIKTGIELAKFVYFLSSSSFCIVCGF